MKKEIDLQQIIIDADLYVRNKKVGKQPEHQTPSSAGQTDQGVNFVSGVPNDKRGKGKGKGKNRGRGGNANRGGYNTGDYQGGSYQDTANMGRTLNRALALHALTSIGRFLPQILRT